MKKMLFVMGLLVAGSLQLSAATMKVTCCDGRVSGAEGISLEFAKKYLDAADYAAYVESIAETACGKEGCSREVEQVVQQKQVEDLAKTVNP